MNPRPSPAEALDGLPLEPLVAALGDADAYVVGGWVREVLAGRDPGGDLDVAVDADVGELLDRLDPALEIEVHERHSRFGTATVGIDGLHVDLSRTRRETYAHPGALPDVEPAPIGEDLRRRDFTVNAIALPVRSPHELLDPHDGASDLRDGVLRVLHDGSFADDPTRAIRAARYASRLDLEPDPRTRELLRETDLDAVSADRRDAELARLAAEPSAPRGFRLLAEWGLLPLDEATLGLIESIDATAPASPWAGEPETRRDAILIAAAGGERLEAALRLARTEPERPSEGVRLAAGHAGGRAPDRARRRSAVARRVRRRVERGEARDQRRGPARGRDPPGAGDRGGAPRGARAQARRRPERRPRGGARARPGPGAQGRLSGRRNLRPMDWREADGVRWLEAELPHGVRAAFSARVGGVSEGDFESLNIGFLTDDETERVIENRRRLSSALGVDPADVVIGRQVHGAEIARHDGRQAAAHWASPGPEPPHVDGHATSTPGLAGLVFVADCLPIALAGPGGVAIVHGGWRGLAGGIVGRGAEAVGATAAAVGPGIGPCCYEVGDEVLAAFAPLGPGLADGRMLDLIAVARKLLERAGVEEIDVAGLCTRCNQDLFFSHRGAGGHTGRQAGIAWIEAA